MPYILTIRSAETLPLEVPEADSYEDIDAALRTQVPEGFSLTDISVSQPRGTSHMVGVGAARRTETRELTIAHRGQLQESIPEGWIALSIREA
ncbi:MAG: hypothetical protein ACTHX2_01735 [Microbacterium sp.]